MSDSAKTVNATQGIGDRYQQETQYVRDRIGGHSLDWAHRPQTIKTYPGAPQIPLPAPRTQGGAALWEALKERRSVRLFRGQPMDVAQVAQLLWAAQGLTHGAGEHRFRTAPSAGALYPIETYLAVHSVEGLDSGLYHYAVVPHVLEQLRAGDYRLQTARAALDQRMAHDADLVLLWTAVFGRSKWKYDQRAYRYVYLDAGHIAQNVALASVALGLGSCHIAALYDREANDLLGVDGESESVIYMTVVGRAP